MTHIASDLHLDHDNIIDYCDQPFQSTSEMNRALIENWNDSIEPKEKVIFLGDLVPFEERDHVIRGWLNKLNGQFVFVYGNHDETVPIKSHHHLTLDVQGYNIYLTHYPEDIPENWDGWAIYGHHHNNFPDEYPFVDPANKRINVSIELLGFEPLPITELFEYIRNGDPLTVRPSADPARALQNEEETSLVNSSQWHCLVLNLLSWPFPLKRLFGRLWLYWCLKRRSHCFALD